MHWSADSHKISAIFRLLVRDDIDDTAIPTSRHRKYRNPKLAINHKVALKSKYIGQGKNPSLINENRCEIKISVCEGRRVIVHVVYKADSFVTKLGMTVKKKPTDAGRGTSGVGVNSTGPISTYASGISKFRQSGKKIAIGKRTTYRMQD